MHQKRHISVTLKRSMSITLTVVLMLSLVACKDTTVLAERIQNQRLGEVDYSVAPKIWDSPDQIENDYLRNLALNPDANHGEFTPIVATYDKEPTTEDSTDQTPQSNDKPANAQGSTVSGETMNGDSSQGGSGLGTSGGSGTDPEGHATSDPGDGDRDGDGDDSTDPNPDEDNNSQGGNTSTGGSGGTGTVYNDGAYTVLPQANTIAAVGDYALIVQMLAGKGALVAADEDWLNTVRATSAFPNEGLDRVVAGWSGEGKQAGCARVQAIVDSRAEAVLVGSNTSTLTQDECDQLVEAGIDIVVMPAIGVLDAPDANITTTVRIVGEILNTATARSRATRYVNLHNAAINDVLSANDGYVPFAQPINSTSTAFSNRVAQYNPSLSDNSHGGSISADWFSSNLPKYTFYIDSWDYFTRSYSYLVEERPIDIDIDSIIWLDRGVLDLTDGFGKAAISSGVSGFGLPTYYLQCAGVRDLSSTFSLHYGHMSWYSNIPMVPYNIEETVPHVSDSGIFTYLYPWPMSVGDQNIRGGSFAFWDIYSTRNRMNLNPITYGQTWIGDSVYPAVIVRDTAIARRLVMSANKPDGYYNAIQPYQIFVVPSGLAGSWVDGNVESFLMAPWIYSMFQQGKDLTASSTYVNEFYNTFYRTGAAGIVSGYGEVYQALCPSS